MFDEESKKRIKQLCDLIAKEQDQRRFSTLIAELNQVLEKMQPIRPRDARPAAIRPSSVPEPPGEPEC